MNEYRIVYQLDGQRIEQRVEAETIAAATHQISADAEIIESKFVRAIGFSCRARGNPGRR